MLLQVYAEKLLDLVLKQKRHPRHPDLERTQCAQASGEEDSDHFSLELTRGMKRSKTEAELNGMIND
jgi:hypothetical protein